MAAGDGKLNERVLVIVAHPDDEVLGCGGTIARHVASGDAVHMCFLTDGVGARGDDAGAAARRNAAARRAVALLGGLEPVFNAFPDNQLDRVDLLTVVKAIESEVVKIRPTTIYTHHAGDLNIDHVICNRAVLTACRPLPGQSVRNIYAMEIASSTEWGFRAPFVPTRYVDISKFLELKRRALEAYAEELRAFPHPRSYEAVEALGRWRGSAVGLAAAEAFMVLREIEH